MVSVTEHPNTKNKKQIHWIPSKWFKTFKVQGTFSRKCSQSGAVGLESSYREAKAGLSQVQGQPEPQGPWEQPMWFRERLGQNKRGKEEYSLLVERLCEALGSIPVSETETEPQEKNTFNHTSDITLHLEYIKNPYNLPIQRPIAQFKIHKFSE